MPKSRVGGQGPYLRSLDHLGRSSEAKDRKKTKKRGVELNKAGYTATPVACGWAGAIFEVT